MCTHPWKGASQGSRGFRSRGPLVDLRRCFSNPRKPLKTLISHVIKGSRRGRGTSRPSRITDQRGPVRENSAQTQTRLSASNRADLLAAYADGVPVRQLAARFKVHRGTVSEIARRAGLEPRSPTLPQSVREDAARLYAEGLTLVEVGVKLGISHNAVRSAVVACGGTLRPAGRRPALV